ncbi:MAG: insulinase family protein, partial [Clostridia bacterium]
DVLHDYRAKSYTSKATVVSVSGSFDDSLVEYLKARFGEMPTCEKLTYTPAVYNRAITCKSKDIEQNHICICFPGFSYNDEARYTLRMLNSILGGGMSSRLFQSVRENAGLCYSIASFANAYADAGELNFYVALGRDTERAALELMKSEIIKMAEHGVTQSELDRVREHYKAGLVMAMESTSKRMTLGAQSVMRTGRVPDIEELLRDTDAVTTENVKELACSMFMFENASFSGVGKLRDRREYIKFLG